MSPPRKKRIDVRIELRPGVLAQFEAKAKEEGKTPREIVAELVAAYAAGRIRRVRPPTTEQRETRAQIAAVGAGLVGVFAGAAIGLKGEAATKGFAVPFAKAVYGALTPHAPAGAVTTREAGPVEVTSAPKALPPRGAKP